jgi:prepilin-type N-terminal cleavage/methylation domain-containing protein
MHPIRKGDMPIRRRQRDERPCRSRSGVTLFEMLVVLALLVVAASIAWPAVEGSFQTARLRNAADRLRTVWSEARLEAMRTGTIHEFRYESGGPTYQVRSWASLATAPAETAAPERPHNDFEAAFAETALPPGVTFATGMQDIDQRAGLTAAVTGANVAAEGNYSPPILFYPDGTTVDAVVFLQNERNLYIRVALRSLTGISRMSGVLTVDELE